MSAKFYVGDVFDVLAALADDSVDLIVTSPPFLALRSYLPADHEHKSKELGSEATPGMFIDRLLDVVEACARVLAPHGSLVFELGDTYAGSGGAGGDYNEGGLRDGAPKFTGSASRRNTPTLPWADDLDAWPLDKSKVLIPQLFAIALAYGFNPLTGRQTEPWRVRNTVAWCRPNPPVGRDGDKFRPATSFLTVACKARDRYWDGDAVRTEHVPRWFDAPRRKAYGVDDARIDGGGNVRSESGGKGVRADMPVNPAGAPLLDYWIIPTAPYKGSHYATYPPDLVVPLIKSMTPARVCRVCGKPSTRIVGQTADYAAFRAAKNNGDHGTTAFTEAVGNRAQSWDHQDDSAARGETYETLGWSDCGHDDWRSGLILDPFAGSGTTLSVATGHGFDCIGIDLDERNADLARERVGMFLEVETLGAASAVRPIVETEAL